MKKQQQTRTAIYCRLSRDDEQSGESMSIENQRILLRRYAKEQGFEVVEVYTDDGWSGTNFDRPDFQRMKRDIENGGINIVLVKDLSRLGRNQIETSLCIQVFFPEHQVRFIAVSENIDTAKGEDDFMELRNLFNEWFVRDTSRKVKSGYRQRALNGDYTGAFAPYGYRKDEQNKHKLVPDEHTATVVQRIFRLAVEGHSPFKIGRLLRADCVLTPRAYLAEQHQRYLKVVNTRHPYDWGATTVKAILQNKAHLGHMVSHKATKLSFKKKRVVAVPEEEWIEVQNTHEPLIDEETFALAQKVIRVRKRPTKEGEHQIFAGLLKCSTCGQGLSFARGGSSKNSGGKGGRGSFACNQSRTRGKAYCSFHYISYVDIYEIILADIRRHAQTAREKERAFAEKLATVSQNQQKKQWSAAVKERLRLNSRESELQTIQRKLYEDNALGRITDEQYAALSRDFTAEQAQLKERLKLLDDQLNQAESKQENTTRFLELVREYTDMKELTKPILNELIDKVVVYDAEKVGGKRVVNGHIVSAGNKCAFADWNGFPLFFSRCNLLSF
ncbi:recombinase family protein [Paenibacillus sp. IB182496]|uniref:Recombinase family protein n=1 Tax=Paenibacillus sabuli TaxID=2772509 RepID=A0A927GR18_9BACL|nr:recombinase family protein [Paenibacillus sabuli]MBD2844968.1 recombinase family protein [Paenibacillus sabuli]